MIAAIPFPDISPVIVSIDLGPITFALRWYALAYIAGILIGWGLAILALRRDALWGPRGAPMSTDDLDDLLTVIILGVILGGRLGYVFFYQFDYYLAHPWEILAVWQGGMAFHGGLLGVALAGIWFAATRDVPLLSLADILALGTPPGLLLGRLANFVNAELWGAPTDRPWGVIFPGYAAQDCPRVEGVCARHPTQLYEAGLEGLLLGAALILLAFAAGALRRRGRIAGTFLAGYAAARILVEIWRQADPQFITAGNPEGHVIALGAVGLSMGQVLSLPMLALGIALLLLSGRRAA